MPTKSKEKKYVIDSKIRDARFLSQDQLAEKAGVSRATISGAENGTTIISIETAIKIADALNVTLDELFGRTSHIRYTYSKPGLRCLTLNDFKDSRLTSDGKLTDKWDRKRALDFYRFDQDFEYGDHYIAIRGGFFDSTYSDDHDEISIIDTLWRKYINQDMSRPYKTLIKVNNEAFWTYIGLLKNETTKFGSKEYYYYDSRSHLVLASDKDLSRIVIGVLFEVIQRTTSNSLHNPVTMPHEFDNETSYEDRYELNHLELQADLDEIERRREKKK